MKDDTAGRAIMDAARAEILMAVEQANRAKSPESIVSSVQRKESQIDETLSARSFPTVSTREESHSLSEQTSASLSGPSDERDDVESTDHRDRSSHNTRGSRETKKSQRRLNLKQVIQIDTPPLEECPSDERTVFGGMEMCSPRLWYPSDEQGLVLSRSCSLDDKFAFDKYLVTPRTKNAAGAFDDMIHPFLWSPKAASHDEEYKECQDYETHQKHGRHTISRLNEIEDESDDACSQSTHTQPILRSNSMGGMLEAVLQPFVCNAIVGSMSLEENSVASEENSIVASESSFVEDEFSRRTKALFSSKPLVIGKHLGGNEKLEATTLQLKTQMQINSKPLFSTELSAPQMNGATLLKLPRGYDDHIVKSMVGNDTRFPDPFDTKSTQAAPKLDEVYVEINKKTMQEDQERQKKAAELANLRKEEARQAAYAFLNRLCFVETVSDDSIDRLEKTKPDIPWEKKLPIRVEDDHISTTEEQMNELRESAPAPLGTEAINLQRHHETALTPNNDVDHVQSTFAHGDRINDPFATSDSSDTLKLDEVYDELCKEEKLAKQELIRKARRLAAQRRRESRDALKLLFKRFLLTSGREEALTTSQHDEGIEVDLLLKGLSDNSQLRTEDVASSCRNDDEVKIPFWLFTQKDWVNLLNDLCFFAIDKSVRSSSASEIVKTDDPTAYVAQFVACLYYMCMSIQRQQSTIPSTDRKSNAREEMASCNAPTDIAPSIPIDVTLFADFTTNDLMPCVVSKYSYALVASDASQVTESSSPSIDLERLLVFRAGAAVVSESSVIKITTETKTAFENVRQRILHMVVMGQSLVDIMRATTTGGVKLLDGKMREALDTFQKQFAQLIQDSIAFMNSSNAALLSLSDETDSTGNSGRYQAHSKYSFWNSNNFRDQLSTCMTLDKLLGSFDSLCRSKPADDTSGKQNDSTQNISTPGPILRSKVVQSNNKADVCTEKERMPAATAEPMTFVSAGLIHSNLSDEAGACAEAPSMSVTIPETVTSASDEIMAPLDEDSNEDSEVENKLGPEAARFLSDLQGLILNHLGPEGLASTSSIVQEAVNLAEHGSKRKQTELLIRARRMRLPVPVLNAIVGAFLETGIKDSSLPGNNCPVLSTGPPQTTRPVVLGDNFAPQTKFNGPRCMCFNMDDITKAMNATCNYQPEPVRPTPVREGMVALPPVQTCSSSSDRIVAPATSSEEDDPIVLPVPLSSKSDDAQASIQRASFNAPQALGMIDSAHQTASFNLPQALGQVPLDERRNGSLDTPVQVASISDTRESDREIQNESEYVKLGAKASQFLSMMQALVMRYRCQDTEIVNEAASLVESGSKKESALFLMQARKAGIPVLFLNAIVGEFWEAANEKPRSDAAVDGAEDSATDPNSSADVLSYLRKTSAPICMRLNAVDLQFSDNEKGGFCRTHRDSWKRLRAAKC